MTAKNHRRRVSRTTRLSATQSLTVNIAKRPFHRLIGYANCWEDPLVLQAALQVGPGDRCLSITSGGCNTLALLLHDPASIVGLDFNPNQNHLLRLKMACLCVLDHGEKLELLGVRASARRTELYQRVRGELPSESRQFWDANRGMIMQGVLFAGRLERYMRLFGKLIGLILGSSKIDQFMACPDVEAQRSFYRRHWDGLRWRSLFDIFFSRAVLSRAKDQTHFRYVDFRGFGKRFRARAQHLLTDLPLAENYFMALTLLGKFYREEYLPPYLLAEHHEILRSRLDRIQLINGDLEGYLARIPDEEFTRFNLSNLFDWFSEANFVRVHREIVRVAKNEARLCWWNTLAVRHLPGEIPEIVPEDGLAVELLARDRFIYAQFQVGRISKALDNS
ncbi:MAG: DUF3419 family protein [Cyanobacteria bacterium NC_groundwater_1444_Ag_S-0.65um_54_12]|nr:DUF3419 family protein [Cyanobacteria bacterium NC_groundwater_1444_Ag_S-0.65um_54_12]